MTYWQKQQVLVQQRQREEGFNFIQQELIKSYSRAAQNVVSDMEDLYLEMLEEGGISLARMYQQDRYYKLLANINRELQALGGQEIQILDQGLLDLYNRTGEFVSGNDQFAIINRDIAEEAIKRAWCQDGQTYSDRIWKHKTELQTSLQDGLMDCVIRGRSHKYLSRELRQRFGVSERQSECIARTELNYIQNQAAMRGYLDAGYQFYEFISAVDDRICDDCEELNGQVFPFSEANEGVNFPPIHPNCRSNIIGYKE